MELMDKLTGNTWARELEMYMKYHGLSREQGIALLECDNYADRDRMFDMFVGMNKG